MLRRLGNILVIAGLAAGALDLSACRRPKPVVAPELPPSGAATSAGAATAPTPLASTVREEPTVATAELPEGAVAAQELPADLAALNQAGYLADVYFDTNKHELRPDARQALAANASWLRAHRTVRILVEGHCDERNTEEYNLALGWRRAHAVKDYLVSLGVEASRIETLSLGEEKPFATCHEESCWWQNRRAHFVITAR
ncbi:MAG: peptidoglycan-associated lipoprotein Pal [Thermoanaerobaculaceae bacterium]|nr:peptidoglycan-associated lipoprotein Pal [Thermoanaerobaculaceae bacterium]